MLLWAVAQKPITMSPPALSRDWGRVILDTINWHQSIEVTCTVAECPFAVQLTSFGLCSGRESLPAAITKRPGSVRMALPASFIILSEREDFPDRVRVAPAGIRISLCI